MKKHCLLLLLIMLLFSTGCGNSESQSIVSESDSLSKSISRNDQSMGGMEEPSVYDKEKIETEVEGSKIERKIIRNANVTLEVENPIDTLNEIEIKIKQLNGWLVGSSSNGYENNSSAEIQVRIPEEELDGFLIWIDSIAKITYKRCMQTK